MSSEAGTKRSEAPLLRARDLVKTYGTGSAAVAAVRGVSLDLLAGDVVMVMGPSGSGKTTLLSMIGGLLRPSSGTVEIAGADITNLSERDLADIRARKIGFVFQAFNLLTSLTVEENVLFPARLLPGGIREARGRVRSLLDRLGLTARRNALPRALSGGEKQRVAVARALVNDAPLILADEPTGNLDSERGQEVVMILRDLAREEGRGVLVVTHDSRVEDVADEILWLEDGVLHDRPAGPRELLVDPICGMRVDARHAAFTASDPGGRLVAFCSSGCRDRYLGPASAAPTAR